VTPLYTGIPAPVGLADFGLSSTSNGSVVGSILNTTSVRASVDFNATGVVANDLFQSSPDSFGIQLNAVMTDVTILGVPGYSYWTQNVVLYYPEAHAMVLVTNVWNFTSRNAALQPGTIYSHGPDGTNYSAALGYYYAQLAVPNPIAYPFNLTMFLNSTVTSGRDAVDFNVLVQTGSTHLDFPYDFVAFNSIRSGGHAVSQPSNYTANGKAYNAIGLTNDFELIFGGPGGGSQADLFASDDTLGLAYLSGASYLSVPSASNYGGETGETVTGANVGWSNAPGGPAGLPTYGTMTTGPTFLGGLWNDTGPAGAYALTLHVSPSNAFTFVTPVNVSHRHIVQEASYAPSVTTSTFHLAPGNYSLLTELSDFNPVTTSLALTGPKTVWINLTANATEGIYTPLWAWTNAQLAALSTSGTGTPTSPYVIENAQPHPIVANFGLYNDFAFPVFPGVFLEGTNASVEFHQPASLATSTNTFQSPGGALPSTNDLQYWFETVSHVAIVNASNISGWFSKYAYYPTGFNTFSVVFYESSQNLIAGNRFVVDQGLLVYSGGSFSNATNIGGGGTTVWGNNFTNLANPPSWLPFVAFPALGYLGVEIAEKNDVVYNNAILTWTTAWLLPFNLYSGSRENYSAEWNITPQAATNVHFATGFPLISLTGSVVGTLDQGGNFWWDYGLAVNPHNGADDPYGVLPYDEKATTLAYQLFGSYYYDASYLYNGGDDAPLVPYALYNGSLVASTPHGAAAPPVDLNVIQTHTNAVVRIASIPSNGGNLSLELPNGPYRFVANSTSGYTVSPPQEAFSVNGSNFGTIHLLVTKTLQNVTFSESGLPNGTPWTVTFNGSTTTTSAPGELVYYSPNGTFAYSVRSVPGTPATSGQPATNGYAPSPSVGNVTLTGAGYPAAISFSSADRLTFRASGLPSGTGWSVRTLEANGNATVPVTGPSTIVLAETGGVVRFTVTPPTGYGVAEVTGPRFPTFTTANVTRTTALVVHFGPLEDLYFNATGSVPANWSVTISSAYLHGGAPGSQTKSTSGGSIEFTNVVKGAWKFVVAAPAGYLAHPPHGTVLVPPRTDTRAIRFALGA
jgi:thermopsin